MGQVLIANEILTACAAAAAHPLTVFPNREALTLLGYAPDAPYDAWKAGYAGLGATNADDDRDGVPNLVEYTLGTSPKVLGSPFQFTGGTLRFATSAVGLGMVAHGDGVGEPVDVVGGAGGADQRGGRRDVERGSGCGGEGVLPLEGGGEAVRPEGRGQRAEGRGQRAEGRGQRAEGRGWLWPTCFLCPGGAWDGSRWRRSDSDDPTGEVC